MVSPCACLHLHQPAAALGQGAAVTWAEGHPGKPPHIPTAPPAPASSSAVVAQGQATLTDVDPQAGFCPQGKTP